MSGRTAEHVGVLMKVECDHDCSKIEGSQMVVMAVEASYSLLTGVFTLSSLWPVSGNP